MKQAQNKGGRPELSKGRVRRYIVSTRLDTEHLDFVTQLKGIARNLNQLTRLAHAKGFSSVASRHAAIMACLEALLKQIRDDR